MYLYLSANSNAFANVFVALNFVTLLAWILVNKISFWEQ